MKDFLAKDWCSSDKTLILTIAFLSGIIFGFLIAPVKKGIYCGDCCQQT